MNWVKALLSSELPEGARQVVKIAERDILLVNLKGQVYAVNNRCPHMGAPLVQGEVKDDGTIVCRRHHSAFDLRTGDVKDWAPWPPAVSPVLGVISREKPLPIFQTKVEDASIWVGIEESR